VNCHVVHGSIQTARGALTDGDWLLADALLRDAVDAVKDLEDERDRYRQALEAARDALADPNAMAEDTDSPANMAFAIANHALGADELSRKGSS
jgi:hypothetical protein